MRVIHKTVTTATYEKLKADISAGKYKPGDHLLLKQLSEDLQVSRTPIRDALIRLQEEGLVEAKPHRGMYVRKLKEKDISNYYQTRAVLEGLGAKLAAENIKQEETQVLEDFINRMEKVLIHREDQGDEAIIKLNNSLHDYIFKIADNEVLDRLRRTLASPIALIRATSWIDSERKYEVFKEHEKLIIEIIAKNPERAKEAAENHIHKAWESANRNLKKLPEEED
ncbi:GntR family transcriptional regulator [Alteribacillus iranensis]|uniref:DNA-binding transcriptional regulator, GntR family n=1 Tax=Alteribacillus iranensis TaxID=930128 RepID=A0A1I2BBR2_9BACI|nr:GntR family transcriptional regulator [Alteribacillus iranensis]SFE53585.1 DNA-binding transcriptional regulator, GntR family [Alteribacillus iranensis]